MNEAGLTGTDTVRVRVCETPQGVQGIGCLGRGSAKLVVKGDRASVLPNERVLEVDSGEGRTRA